MKSRTVAAAYTAVMSLAVTLIALFASEVAFRVIDGYELTSVHLVQHSPPPDTAGKSAAPYVASMPLAPGMQREWFDLSPPALPRDKDPELLAGYRKFPNPELFHVYNSRVATKFLCKNGLFQDFPNFMFLYDPPNDSEYPRYRHPLNKVSPLGLPTNQYGFRGSPISWRKPERTIRIAFVGASTTVNDHNYAFSYPELAGFWLDKWAQQNFGVRVETINAGREGLNSTDFVAIVRDELLPMEPDLVVYYEGANQFTPNSIVQIAGDVGKSPVPFPSPAAHASTGYLQNHSAMARRIAQLAGALGMHSAAEPDKPDFRSVWPSDVNEQDPPLDHQNLPVNLTTILRDLDQIRTMLSADGATLVPSSYFWLVYDGMKLDPVRHAVQYWYVNNFWWPYRYRDMERLAAFENRVFKKYASARGLPFIDVAATMPRDHDLFNDAVHATYEGVKLHGWIVAQALAPLLRERIASGQLPRPFKSQLKEHPAFPGNERTAVFNCKPDVDRAKLLGELSFSDGVTVIPPAIVDQGESLRVRIPKGTPENHYMALVSMPFRGAPDHSGVALNASIKVTGGEVGIGVLSSDQKRFLIHQKVGETKGVESVTWIFTATEELGPLVIGSGPTRDNEVTIEIRDAKMVTGRFPIDTYASGLAIPR